MVSDETHTLRQLTVEVAVIRESMRRDKEAMELAAKEYARRLELADLSSQLPQLYVTRELHDKLSDKMETISKELSSWQGRLFMLSAVIAGILAVMTTAVAVWHFVPS
jgi:hypothetical protein